MKAQSINNIQLPDGNYLGYWSGYQVRLLNNYTFHTDKGVKGKNIQVEVFIRNSKATVIERKWGMFQAEGDSFDLIGTIKPYAKYFPLAGAGLGLLIGFRKGKGLMGIAGRGIIGLAGGVGIAMLLGETGVFSSFTNWFSQINNPPKATPEKIKEAMDWLKENIKDLKVEQTQEFLNGFSERDINVMLEIIKWRKENNFPVTDEEKRTRLKTAGLTEGEITDYMSVFPSWNNVIPIF